MKKIIFISSILTVSLLAFLSTENKTEAYASGAPNGYTGAPMDNGGSTCGACHAGSAVTPTTGVISSDIPASGFIGGTTYNFIITMSGSLAYGFEVSAQTPISSSAVGTLIANDPGTQISGNYITHNAKKTGASASWTFQWTAPLTGTTVTIYGGFNYANNNSTNSGDLIRTSSVTYTACTIPATPTTISGNTTICASSSNTYSIALVSGATSYNWTLPGGWTGISTSNTISTTASSTSGNISVSANNSCGTSPIQTLAITVNSIPNTPTTIIGNANICASSSNTYSIALVSGATSYNWALPGGWTGSSISNTISTTASSTSGNISVSANNSCGASPAQTLAIAVNSIPNTPTAIIGNTNVCATSSNTYSIALVSGATSYNWALPGGWTGSSTSNTISTTASSTSGNISVSANNSCGTSPAQILAITVNSIPNTPITISGNTTVCASSSNTYSIALVGGATSYNWTLPGGWTGSSSSNTISTTASTTSGNISVSASNSCGTSAVKTLSITVNSIPTTPTSISGNTNICTSSSNTYSVALVSGATSYNWALPGGWTGSSSSNTISTTASATSGNISVSANNSCGASNAQTLAITVNSIPTAPTSISGNTNICSSTSNTYSVALVSGATSYNWTLPGGWVGSSTSNTISTTASSTSGNISVSANNSCGTSAVKTLSVTVNFIPTTPIAVSGNTNICSSSSNTYSVAPVSGATAYIWSLPSGWTGSSFSNTISAIASLTSGNISVSANNFCGTSAVKTLSITVNSIPTTPIAISGNTNICTSSSNTYSIALVSGATSYNWTLPGGWTGSSTSNTISTTASSTSGNISAAASNSCGVSPAQTLAITVNSIPNTPVTISGNTNVCASSSNTYSTALVSGATSYNWALPSGWTGSSTSNTISTTANSTSGNISVSANNFCGTSPAQTLAITVNSIPTTPTAISGNTNICASSSNTYSIALISGATAYIWSLPSGWTGSSFSNTISTTASSTSGNISVSANNFCGTSPSQTLAVTVFTASPNMPGSITGNTGICASSLNTYSISLVNGANSYTWILPIGWTGSSTSNSISSTAGSTGGNILVSANNSCGSSASQTLNVIVSGGTALPQPSSITGNTNICSSSSNTYIASPVSGATSYIWSLPGGWTGSSSSNTISTTANSTGGNISVSANNFCGSSAAQTLAITVNSIPTTPTAINGNTTICASSSNTYSVSPVSGATSYIWSLPGGWAGTSSSNTISATPNSTSGTISVAANNFCGTSSAQTLAVIVDSIPTSPTTIDGNTNICGSSSNTYSVSPINGATSYIWMLPGGWIGTSSSNIISTTANSSGGTISVSANNFCGSSAAQTLTIMVNSIPSIPTAITGNTNICASTSNSYSISLVSGASSYNWTLPVAWTGSSTSNTISTIASSTSGTISVSANNFCGTSAAQTLAIIVDTIPTSPTTISGNASICSSSSNTYSVSPINGATSYVWILPGGWVGTSSSNTISTTASSASGTISVAANNFCGSSVAQTLAVITKTIDTSATQSGLVLTANIASATYQWINCSNNLPISGAISQSYTATSNGNYAVIITTNGCTDTSSCFNITSVNINEINSLTTLNFYPNPTSGKINFSANDIELEKKYKLIIYNVDGIIIYQSENISEVDISNQPNGIYLLKIYDEQKYIIKKILKQ